MQRTMISSSLAVVCLALSACSHHNIDRVRYKNQPVVTEVTDRDDIGTSPDERPHFRRLSHFDALVHRRITRATELRGHRLAGDINALGEVPNSSWFENRIGVRDISVEELREGPNQGEGPMANKPWRILSSKTAGAAPGFIIEDSAGDKYLLKFDVKGEPENETGAHIVVHRLLWALGYHVPEDRLVWVKRGDLRLAEDAAVKDTFGNESKMTETDLEMTLARAHVGEDGVMRALVSKFVPGKPIGGFPDEGVRDDDPNDTIAHENRRVLRGLYPIFAWLKHTDVKEGNTLDALIEEDERKYVRHYLIDFGKALGIISRQSSWRSDGFSRWIDFGDAAKSTVTLGLYKREWDGLEAPDYKGLGLYQVERYDPGSFEVRSPWQPFLEYDAQDAFWGSKLIMRLTPAHIRAAVDEGQFSDPRTREYLAETMIARQRKTARYWFMRVNPLDRFSVERGERGQGGMTVCFDDLLATYELATPAVLAATRYAVSVHNYDGDRLGYETRLTRDVKSQRLCLSGVPAGNLRDGYTIINIETVRPGADYEPVLVHIATRGDKPKVIGLRRLD